MKNYRVLSILTLLMLLIVLMSTDWFIPRKTVRGKSTGLPLVNDPTSAQLLAQDLALSDVRVQQYTAGYRTEIFGTRAVGDQYPATSTACANADCRQVEIYNFDQNAAILAIVDVDNRTVLDVLYQPGAHPGINKRLADLATAIALNHPDVRDALGFRPTEVSMAPVDGGLADSACIDHFCVAPTFEVGDRNLWAIVDLTDETLLRVAWTDLAPNMPNGSIHFTAPASCPTPGQVKRLSWDVQYEVTGTDGFRVYNVTYNGMPVLTSVKLAEWHAAYAGNSWGFEDYTGCGGGGGGFPISPFGDTQVLDLVDETNTVIGFEVVQDFRMSNWGYNCNYRYEQHMQFYEDGRFRVVAGAYGRDCGSGSAIYRPLVRIDIAVNGADNDSLAAWSGSDWITQTTEFWELQNIPYTAEGYRWRVTDQTGAGYYIEPGRGQFNDGGQGDTAYFYVVAHHPNEGDTDLPIIGDCCATGGDYRQGPHLFLNNEGIENTDIVLWYVPQSQANSAPDHEYCWTVSGEPNPETYPCFAGPMFVPVTQTQFAPVASFMRDNPVRIGETAVFTNTTTGTPPLTYTWSFGDSMLPETQPNPTHVYTTTGSYTITLQATNALSTSVASSTIDVGDERATITPAVTGTLTYTGTANSINITVPGDALTQTTTLLFTMQETADPLADMAFADFAFSLGAYQQRERLPGYHFARPVTVTLRYEDTAVADLWENALTLMVQSDGQWLDAASTCAPPATYVRNLSQNELTIAICQLGEFALFAPNANELYLPFILYSE